MRRSTTSESSASGQMGKAGVNCAPGSLDTHLCYAVLERPEDRTFLRQVRGLRGQRR